MVFDTGRGIHKLENQSFLDIESNLLPVPRPRAGHAWYCLLFWNKQLSQEHYIWFIKLPIDEHSLLQQAARNQFLEVVVTALGKDIAKSEQALPDNPFIYQPSQQQLADINAISHYLLNVPERAAKIAVEHYFNAPSVQDWQQLSLQGIADYVARLNDANMHTLSQVLPNLPKALQISLMSSLESASLNTSLTNSLISLYDESTDIAVRHACARAVSAATDEHQQQLFLSHMLQQSLDQESLVIIAGRYWPLLAQSADSLMTYMNKVAEFDVSHRLFIGIYSDLVQVPATRAGLLALLRNPDKPDALTAAIGRLFSGAQA